MWQVSMLEVFAHRASLFISSLSSSTIFSKPRASGLFRVVLEGLCTQFGLLLYSSEKKKKEGIGLSWWSSTFTVNWDLLVSKPCSRKFLLVVLGRSLGVYILPGNSDMLVSFLFNR